MQGLNRFYDASVYPHLPPRFTQFNWMFASTGSLLAHQFVVTGNNEDQWNGCDEARIRTRQLQRVETPGYQVTTR